MCVYNVGGWVPNLVGKYEIVRQAVDEKVLHQNQRVLRTWCYHEGNVLVCPSCVCCKEMISQQLR